MKIILIYFALKYEGNWDKIYDALDSKEPVSMDELRNTEKIIEKSDWKITTILDTDYPIKLKQAYKPPFVVWSKGNQELLDKSLYCVTGNEILSNMEVDIKDTVDQIYKENVIVTSGWKGVDEYIDEYIADRGKVIILANGSDKPYVNIKIRETDLVMTEFSPNTHVSKRKFHARNRMVAAFSESLVLLSSNKNGGINQLVTEMLNLGKDIYCFPGDGSENDGNSVLIKQGATYITSVKDISTC